MKSYSPHQTLCSIGPMMNDQDVSAAYDRWKIQYKPKFSLLCKFNLHNWQISPWVINGRTLYYCKRCHLTGFLDQMAQEKKEQTP